MVGLLAIEEALTPDPIEEKGVPSVHPISREACRMRLFESLVHLQALILRETDSL